MLKIDSFDKHIEELEALKQRLLECKSLEGKVDSLKEMYTYAKVVAPDFYDEETKEPKGYMDVIYQLESAEDMLPNDFITNIPPFRPSDRFETISTVNKNAEFEFIMDFLVEKARTRLYNKYDMPFSMLDLQNECYGSSLYIKLLCFLNGIQEKRIKIEPGFKKRSKLYGGGCSHYVNIISTNGKLVLIDCTYSQFFMLKRCLKESIGIMEHRGAYPGTFMQDGLRRKVSDILIARGWIELTPQIWKAYLDGFAVSYRNGLYYEDTKDFSQTTNYTAKDYNSFLQNHGSQLDYEGEHLGYQMRPLKNPYMKF